MSDNKLKTKVKKVLNDDSRWDKISPEQKMRLKLAQDFWERTRISSIKNIKYGDFICVFHSHPPPGYLEEVFLCPQCEKNRM